MADLLPHGMRVWELITLLRGMPQDEIVHVTSYEGGNAKLVRKCEFQTHAAGMDYQYGPVVAIQTMRRPKA